MCVCVCVCLCTRACALPVHASANTDSNPLTLMCIPLCAYTLLYTHIPVCTPQTFTLTHAHTPVCTHTPIHSHSCAHTPPYIHTCLHIPLCTHTFLSLTFLYAHTPIHSYSRTNTPVCTHTPIHSHSCVHAHTHTFKLPCALTHVCTHSPAFLKYPVTLTGRPSHCHTHPHMGAGTHVHSGHIHSDSPVAAKGSSEELPHLTESKSTAEPTQPHTHSRPSTPPNTRRCPSSWCDSLADIWNECSLCLFSPFI